MSDIVITKTMLENTHTYGKTIVLSSVKVPDFATATDAEIAKAITAYYNGTISLDEITSKWDVGDTRNLLLADVSGESGLAQMIQIAIIGINHDELTTAQGGKSNALLTLQTVPCLTKGGGINATNINDGGWKSCSRRTWCNNVLPNAFPTALQSILKNVNKSTSQGNQSSSWTTSSDKTFLLSEIEVFGTQTNSVGNEGHRYEYYTRGGDTNKTAPSRLWWLRSPASKNSTGYCCVSAGAIDYSSGAAINYGLAPAFCL